MVQLDQGQKDEMGEDENRKYCSAEAAYIC